MPWTRVLRSDTTNLQLCKNIMIAMNPYYSTMTLAQVQGALDGSPNMELYVYTDGGTNEIVAAFNPDVQAKKVHLFMLGIRAYGTVAGIGSLIATQFKNAHTKFGINYFYGWIPASGSTTLGNTFYTKLSDAAAGANLYFFRRTANPGQDVCLELVIDKPTDPIISLCDGYVIT